VEVNNTYGLKQVAHIVADEAHSYSFISKKLTKRNFAIEELSKYKRRPIYSLAALDMGWGTKPPKCRFPYPPTVKHSGQESGGEFF